LSEILFPLPGFLSSLALFPSPGFRLGESAFRQGCLPSFFECPSRSGLADSYLFSPFVTSSLLLPPSSFSMLPSLFLLITFFDKPVTRSVRCSQPLLFKTQGFTPRPFPHVLFPVWRSVSGLILLSRARLTPFFFFYRSR